MHTSNKRNTKFAEDEVGAVSATVIVRDRSSINKQFEKDVHSFVDRFKEKVQELSSGGGRLKEWLVTAADKSYNQQYQDILKFLYCQEERTRFGFISSKSSSHTAVAIFNEIAAENPSKGADKHSVLIDTIAGQKEQFGAYVLPTPAEEGERRDREAKADIIERVRMGVFKTSAQILEGVESGVKNQFERVGGFIQERPRTPHMACQGAFAAHDLSGGGSAAAAPSKAMEGRTPSGG